MLYKAREYVFKENIQRAKCHFAFTIQIRCLEMLDGWEQKKSEAAVKVLENSSKLKRLEDENVSSG